MSRMSWKSIISRSECLLGGTAPSINISKLGRTESITLESKVRKMAAFTDHPFVSVLRSHFFHSVPVPSIFSKKKQIKLPGSLMIPLIGQYSYHCFQSHPNEPLKLLQEHRTMGEIYEMINIAIALHRTVVEFPAKSADYLGIHSGNKLATLAADFLLASASISLASFKNTQVVEIMSAAISNTVRAEFSDFITSAEEEGGGCSLSVPSSADDILSQWLDHIELRHGALLGASCEATILLNSSSLSKSICHNIHSLAYRLSTNWACLCRLLDECEFISSKLTSGEKLKYTTVKPLTFPCLGFHQAGIPEPILADLLHNSDSSTVLTLYCKAAKQLCQRLEDNLGNLLKASVPGRGEEEKQLLVDAVHLLLEDCHSAAFYS